MSPELLGLIIGVIFIVPTIHIIRTRKFDAWAWPVFLVTLPIYYMLFGMLAMDGAVILKELLYGLPYITLGLFVWRAKSTATIALLAIAWLSHGLYDYYHNFFFINPGVFAWYPSFCAMVDIAVVAYLLFYCRKLAA